MRKCEFVYINAENSIETITKTEGDFCFFIQLPNMLLVGTDIGGKRNSTDYPGLPEDKAFEFSRMLYMLLSITLKKRQPWGMLTGIRPLMLIQNNFLEIPEEPSENNLLGEYYDKFESAQDEFNKIVAAASAIELKKKYFVSHNKAQLAAQTAFNQKNIIKNAKGISLYISIPFCPSRCDYCSFVSHSIENAFKLIPQYVDLLCLELLSNAGKCDVKVDAVYIGGGTPTVLSAEQLNKILECVHKFNISEDTEITVEAGRPETISEDKLTVFDKHKVNRISINPQTFEQNILDNIGRKHSVKEIYTAFETVRKYDFSINMDIIAGLPGDTLHGFRKSLNKCIKLDPENITVHTLSLKKGAKLHNQKEIENIKFQTVIADKKLIRSEYEPYYLYRQKNTLGNLENTGYAKKGNYCRYNIYTMADCQTILAFGAGGMSKLVYSDKIDRIANFKYPYEYISNFYTILQRKQLAVEEINNGKLKNL
jgi:oxygen-independent coproporphyrinogen-3 oxidase